MTRAIAFHLSEEALDDILIGMGTSESQAHLARCAACRSRVEQFAADVALLNKAGMEWSEAQPGKTVRVEQTPRFHVPIALIGSFVTAILVIAVAIPLWEHQRSVGNVQQPTPVAQPDSEAQIAQDNELMQAVNAAISPQEESPIEEYGLSESRGLRRGARPK
jgi:hypothetical protein